MFCTKCGAQNPDDSKFCGKCGAAFDGTPMQQSAPPPWQPPPPPRKRKGCLIATLLIITGAVVLFFAFCLIVYYIDNNREGNKESYNTSGSVSGVEENQNTKRAAVGSRGRNYSMLSPSEQKSLREDMYRRLDKILIPVLKEDEMIVMMILGGISEAGGDNGAAVIAKVIEERLNANPETGALQEQWCADNNIDVNSINLNPDEIVAEYTAHLLTLITSGEFYK